ncbi:acyloxyacyl hydrolase [Cribrihabitans neustonicus]|uniref:acyloxyacyl hydrolase n=1 Tax=Cribrihabitans neustonicus TaxID=1429085 RepID=UPI003B5B236F
MKRTAVAAAVLTAAFAAPAAAQEVILGLGYSDFSRAGAEDGALASVEYMHRPFYEGRVLSARVGAAFDVQDSGDVFFGAGVSGVWDLRRDWFVEASVMPGVYSESVDLNDLGSTFEIRSQLAVGKRFLNGRALSLALSHKSNASTANDNPGVDTVTLRYHIPLDG